MRPLTYTQYGLAAAIDRHRLRKDAHFVGISMIAVVVCMQFLSVIPLFMLAGAGILDMSQENYGLSADGMALLNLALYLITLAPPVMVTALICRQKTRPFGQHRRVSPLSFICLVGMGMAVCIMANFVANYFVSFLSQFGIGWPDTTGNIQSTPTSLIINLVATALIPGLLEELVFRGYVLQALRPYGDGFAVVVSSLLFGLLHGNVLQIPFAFIVGLICGFVVVQTGNIWVAVVLHMLNNAMAVILTYAGGFLSQQASSRLDTTVMLLVALIGTACFLGLKMTGSPLLDKPSGGWTSLSVKEKWSALFSSPAFVLSLVLMVAVTLFSTFAYSVS